MVSAQPAVRRRGALAYLWRRNRGGLVGAFILLAFLIVIVFAPAVAPYSPFDQDLRRSLLPGFWAGSEASAYPLGTDLQGRDILSRLVYGARVSLATGFIVTAIATIFGALLGLLAGYFGGRADSVIGAAIDVLMSFPPILLAIVIVAVLGTGLERAMLAVAIVYIPRTARVVRSATIVVKSREFVENVLALGVRPLYVIWRYVLPNVAAPTIVQASFTMAGAITAVAGLGFLGLGAQPPTPEWGAMLSDGRRYILAGNWWYAAFPGLAIMLSVLSLNLLGDALQEWLDPQLKTSRR